MGFFTDAYDLFVIGVASALITKDWNLSSGRLALLNSTMLFAAFLGAFVFGRFADVIGRKRVYWIVAAIMIAGALGAAPSPSYWVLIGFRFVLGFGVGGDYPVSAVMVSEYANRKDRGKLVGMVFGTQALGLSIGPLIALPLLGAGASNDTAWRVPLTLGAVAVIYLHCRMPESPRYQVQVQGRAEQAASRMARFTSGQVNGNRISRHVNGMGPWAAALHGLVMASREGAALRPALPWADNRATGSLRAYQLLGSPALARLANPLVPGMTGPLLTWIAENEPRTYRDARWALQPKDWLRARLTGEVHAEPSDASATLLYDVPADRWDLEVVSALGLDASLLAPLLPSAGAAAGHLTAEAGTELGLPAGIPVAAGAADTAAASLGSGIGPGDIQLTIGTGAQVIRPLTAPVSRADAGINLYRSATPDGWYQMGAIISAGLSLNWVRETMNATWEELYASAGHPGQAHDPIFIPHLSGERTPYSDPALPGPGCRSQATGPRSCGARSKEPRSRSATRWMPCSESIARRVSGWPEGALWPLAGGSCSRMCWGCRCMPQTCPRRLAGALPSWGPMRRACSALPISRGGWRRPRTSWPSRTGRWPPSTRSATRDSGGPSPPSRPPSWPPGGPTGTQTARKGRHDHFDRGNAGAAERGRVPSALRSPPRDDRNRAHRRRRFPPLAPGDVHRHADE